MIATGIPNFDAKLSEEQRVDGMTPCIIWNGTRSTWGYGVIDYEGRQWKAHRLAYTLIVGPIPAGLVSDHLCRVHECVNPDHIEPVTNAENVMRGESPQARNARKTHCLNGHELTPENLYANAPGRTCRLCVKVRKAARTAAARANRKPRVSTRGQNVTHGKGGTYRTNGCRCRPCTEANTLDSLRYRQRRRGEIPS